MIAGLKKYGFEFLSIFIAVIAAFALNNWNENRRDRLAESKILTEIASGLEKDMEDLKMNQVGHQGGLAANDYFRDLIAGEPVANDSFLIYYFNITRDFVSLQNTSGYETLKSKGLELITNDSLRRKIISLYEYSYNTLKKLEEEYHELQFQENYFQRMNDLLAPNLQINDQKYITGISTPLKLSEQDEKLLLSYLWKIEANRRFILQYYGVVEQEIEALQREIESELASGK
jgi:hypothetical protein